MLVHPVVAMPNGSSAGVDVSRATSLEVGDACDFVADDLLVSWVFRRKAGSLGKASGAYRHSSRRMMSVWPSGVMQ